MVLYVFLMPACSVSSWLVSFYVVVFLQKFSHFEVFSGLFYWFYVASCFVTALILFVPLWSFSALPFFDCL